MTSPFFPPDAESRAEVDALAANMIAEATSTENPNILSATGFARENISMGVLKYTDGPVRKLRTGTGFCE